MSCDGCRNRLVYYMRILDEDVREEEAPVLDAAMRRWGQRGEPFPQPGGPAKTHSRRAALAAAAGVLIAVALGAVVGLRNPPAFNGREYLEAVLREGRPFRARVSLQEEAEDYVDYVGTRDASRPLGSDEPDLAGLLEGEGAERAGAHLLGLHYLIAGDYNRAVALLREAAGEFQNDPRVQNDLGVAYLVRPKPTREAEADDDNLSRVYLNAAAALDRDFLPAQFNLVLLNMETGMVAEALVRRDAYLEADPDSGWALELRDLVGSGDD